MENKNSSHPVETPALHHDNKEQSLARLVQTTIKDPKRKIAFRVHPNALAARGDVEALEQLLEEGINVDIPSPNGTTPLIAAAKHGQCNVVKLLLRVGAKSKEAALIAAIEAQHAEIIDLLRQTY